MLSSFECKQLLSTHFVDPISVHCINEKNHIPDLDVWDLLQMLRRRSCRYMREKAGPQGRQDLLWKAGSRDLEGINNRLQQKLCLLAECGKTFLFLFIIFSLPREWMASWNICRTQLELPPIWATDGDGAFKFEFPCLSCEESKDRNIKSSFSNSKFLLQQH